MSIHTHQVFEYLDAHPIRNYNGTINSLLNMLCAVYVESNTIETDAIRVSFNEVDSILSNLSIDENNRIFSIVLELCIEYERSAFAHGICVGMHLMTELNALP